MSGPTAHRPAPGEPTSAAGGHAGFTLVESLVALVVGTVVILATFGLLAMQSRTYRVQDEMEAVHATLQRSGHLLTWELRQLSAGDGDIVAITDSTITVRSGLMSAVVCRKNPGSPYEVALARQAGPAPAVGDSLLLFLPGSTGPDDDRWEPYRIQAVLTTSVADCSYGSPAVPGELGLRFTMAGVDTAAVGVGSPVVVFRHATYGAYRDGGERWLGRRIAGQWEKYGGPLAGSGIRFTYREADGSATTTPADVASVEILLDARDAEGSRRDSVRLKVWPRG
jgi:prepilin-type N-terminal cleavage/methylation domain-containing protein